MFGALPLALRAELAGTGIREVAGEPVRGLAGALGLPAAARADRAAGRVGAGDDGDALRAVLAGERTALNLLTHLSGIATATRTLVDAVAGTGCVVRDTRKTLPGLRLVEKDAVLAGGGRNHRMSLVDELLVKDNHVAAAGGMGNAATGALAAADGLPVQIEVDSLAQLDIVLASGGTRVMLDNFSLADTEEGVRRCRALAEETGRPVFVEASGGITIETAAAIAATGVDAVAVGGLTHSSGALDIGLDIAWDTGHPGHPAETERHIWVGSKNPLHAISDALPQKEEF